MSDIEFDPKDFRFALGQFPTGVTIVTTRTKDGEPIGVTASSFNTVSMDPPLILWSVDKKAFSAETFSENEYFVVNVLADSQVATSNRFASRGEDKFKNIAYENGLGDSPVIEGSIAHFECKNWSVYEGGDHFIIVGEVQKYQYNKNQSPLLFSQGKYAVSSAHPDC
ncbi:MAG: flavin reductase family protein [Methylocystaceae bacterium]|nr:flavin reductase family protein [Methylocystaceae bacterium]